MTSTDPLVGRRQELALLRRRLADARAGSGHLVLVSGPAGIGKTRLVEELAGDGAAVGWGAAVADAGMPALWPWVRAVRGMPAPREAVAALVAGNSQREYGTAEEAAAATFAADTAVVDALAEQAGASPGLLVVLDDLQWADRATLRLLDRVAAEIRRLPLLVVGTHRDGSDLRAHRATEVVGLGPLSPGESVTMLSTAVENADTAAVRRAAELSGGSPLYLRTLAKVAVDALRGTAGWDTATGAAPELRHLVAAALRAAGPEAAAAVETLSVLGPDPEPEVVARLLGADSPSAAIELLLPAVPAGLVEIHHGDQVRFAHVLVRDAAYAALPPSRRAALHHAAAELLEPRAVGRDELAGAVARHWHRAGSRTGPSGGRSARPTPPTRPVPTTTRRPISSSRSTPAPATGPNCCSTWPGRSTSAATSGRAPTPARSPPPRVSEPGARTSSAGPRSSFRASATRRSTSGSRSCAAGRCV